MALPGNQILIYLHVILGFISAGIAFYNFSGIRKTTIAGRVKRTAQACSNFSIANAILGVLLVVLLALGSGLTWMIPFVNISIYGLVGFFHLIFALAMITQAAAVAIAYDMWEEKEFNEQTQPGSVPPMPKP